MAVEVANKISDLNSEAPLEGDNFVEGAGHLRAIKQAVTQNLTNLPDVIDWQVDIIDEFAKCVKTDDFILSQEISELDGWLLTPGGNNNLFASPMVLTYLMETPTANYTVDIENTSGVLMQVEFTLEIDGIVVPDSSHVEAFAAGETRTIAESYEFAGDLAIGTEVMLVASASESATATNIYLTLLATSSGATLVTEAPLDGKIYARQSGQWVEVVITNSVESVNSHTGVVVLTPTDLGLENVDPNANTRTRFDVATATLYSTSDGSAP